MFANRIDLPLVAGVVLVSLAGAFAAPGGDGAPDPKGPDASGLKVAAQRTYEINYQLLRDSHLRSVDDLYLWSIRWMRAEQSGEPEPAARRAAVQDHRDRMKQIDAVLRQMPDRSFGPHLPAMRSAITYYVLEAEELVAELDQ